ncbi:hypothetical protein ACIQMO_18170 [Streptomyces sp. NPDC091406]|uniref:hypothetical protein n=1 Tax=unclassified Streptomyces TaxID=2593676 RepID=UPI00380A6610
MESVTARLVRRFGPRVADWCAVAPDLIARLTSRWGLTLGEPLPDGASSVALRCRWPDGTPAVLKISPERALAGAGQEGVATRCARVAAACGLDGDRLHAWSRVIAPFAAVAHLGVGGEEPVIEELLALTR